MLFVPCFSQCAVPFTEQAWQPLSCWLDWVGACEIHKSARMPLFCKTLCMCREGNRVGSRSKLSGSLVEALQDNIVFTVAFNHCLETTENKPHKHICDIRILTELHRSFTRKNILHCAWCCSLMSEDLFSDPQDVVHRSFTWLRCSIHFITRPQYSQEKPKKNKKTRCSPRTRVLTRMSMVEMSKHIERKPHRCSNPWLQPILHLPKHDCPMKTLRAKCKVWSAKYTV